MTKRKQLNKQRKVTRTEADSAYFLKVVLYFVLGAQWLRITDSTFAQQLPIPIGLLIGLVFASHEHFKIDRKIEIAILLVASFIGYWTQVGLYLTIF